MLLTANAQVAATSGDTGSAALDQWNDADGRNLAEVVAAVDRAASVLNGA